MSNQEDFEEAWDMLKGYSKVTLWCDGLIDRSGKRGHKRFPDDADEISTKTKKKMQE